MQGFHMWIKQMQTHAVWIHIRPCNHWNKKTTLQTKLTMKNRFPCWTVVYQMFCTSIRQIVQYLSPYQFQWCDTWAVQIFAILQGRVSTMYVHVYVYANVYGCAYVNVRLHVPFSLTSRQNARRLRIAASTLNSQSKVSPSSPLCGSPRLNLHAHT